MSKSVKAEKPAATKTPAANREPSKAAPPGRAVLRAVVRCARLSFPGGVTADQPVCDLWVSKSVLIVLAALAVLGGFGWLIWWMLSHP